MAAKEKLPFGFVFLSILSCIFWFWMFPYYDFMSAEFHFYVGNLLFIFLHVLTVVPMLLNCYDFNISYDETRNYLKKVSEYYENYKISSIMPNG